tara:strand:+ start:68 stop:337 length:270 start_codon:yes stop_codon:yes gene_type:complete
MTVRDYNKEYYSRPEVKQAHSKYMKEYYLKNKKRLLTRQSEYYSENKEKIKLYMKEYMRKYKPSKKLLLRKDMVDPKSKVVDEVDKYKV